MEEIAGAVLQSRAFSWSRKRALAINYILELFQTVTGYPGGRQTSEHFHFPA